MPPPSSGGVARHRDAERPRRLRPGEDGAGIGRRGSPDGRGDEAGVRRSRALSGRSRLQPDMPVARLISKQYAADLRKTIDEKRAKSSSPTSFEWSHESDETTHISVVDADRNAVSMTYTLEQGYGVEDRRAGRRLPAQQRDGRLQRRAGADDRGGIDWDEAEPRRARQADAVEHDADDPREGRSAVHGHRQPRRPHDHQHRARNDRRRRRFRHERAGGDRRAALPPSVAARPSSTTRNTDCRPTRSPSSSAAGTACARAPAARASRRSSSTTRRKT